MAASAGAAVNSIAATHQRFVAHSRLQKDSKPQQSHILPTPFSFSRTRTIPSSSSSSSSSLYLPTLPITKRPNKINRINASSEDLDVIPVNSNDSVDDQQQVQDNTSSNQVGGFAFESNRGIVGVGDMTTATATAATTGGGGASGFSSSSSLSSNSSPSLLEGEDFNKTADRAINAAIVLAAGTFAITKLLTIDSDYWHGWTIYEILKYAPLHNWTAYEEALKTNPVLAKMMISGVVYSVGDWIAQCYEGKPLFDFDRARMFRSGLVGFSLHGSLSHYYYYFCEALFPSQDWWVVPAKVLFDQTVWAAIWNSIYFVVLGFLRFESPVTIFGELKATFWPMLTAGWKLWPFAHLITYGVIPVEQRLLWVDCVELVWVTILSTYSNEKSEARHSEELSDSSTRSIEE